MQPQSLYEQDFYAWTLQQAEVLRSGRWDLIDVENVVEEIESLGQWVRRELYDHLGVLLGHLLMWHYQPQARSKRWRGTIKEQRRRIQRLLNENPSIRPSLSEAIEFAYQSGLNLIGIETPFNPEQLPQICPFSEAEIFDQPIELDPK